MVPSRSSLFGALLILMLSAHAAHGQQQPTTAELKRDIEALQQGLKAIQQDLQEVKGLLQARQPSPAPPVAVDLELAAYPFKGERTAHVTLVEFSDYQCPYCSRWVRETYPQIVNEYIETGKVKLVFVDFPIESIHRFAFKAGEAARCAGEQGQYWQMHDRLFANQAMLDAWTAHAQAVGLDVAAFETCMRSGKHAAAIRAAQALGQSAGVTGTPAFALALTDPNSTKVKVLRTLRGAQPFSAFKTQIEALLGGDRLSP